MILLNIGYGYVARFLSKEAISKGALVYGITSNIEKRVSIKSNSFKLLNRDKIKHTIILATHLVISAPPDDDGCPIIKLYKNKIIKSNIKCIVYLSSTGVYGDHNGEWVNEYSSTSTSLKKNKNRLKAEKDWFDFSKKERIRLVILRLAGIYGPKRNVFKKINNIDLIIKEGHFFSRIHVYDAARIIYKIMLLSTKEFLWNISDEEPVSQEKLLTEAFLISGNTLPDKVNYEDAKSKMSMNMRGFWESNKRVSGKNILKELDMTLIFRNYKSGLKSLYKEFKNNL